MERCSQGNFGVPREKHIPDDAQRTSICLTAEDRAAIHWLRETRRARRNKRTTINDILIDALWYFLDKTESRTVEQMRAMLPAAPLEQPDRSKIAEMPKPKKRR